MGDKSLVGNKGYRRYLKVEGSGHFAIDEEQVKAEQRYDGIWVLRTNTDYNAPDGRAGDQISGARTTGVVQNPHDPEAQWSANGQGKQKKD